MNCQRMLGLDPDFRVHSRRNTSLREREQVSRTVFAHYLNDDDRTWDELLAHPESDAFLARLGQKTRADIAASRVKEWVPRGSIEALFQS